MNTQKHQGWQCPPILDLFLRSDVWWMFSTDSEIDWKTRCYDISDTFAKGDGSKTSKVEQGDAMTGELIRIELHYIPISWTAFLDTMNMVMG